ncbi:E3 ubiquitin-protein ligase WAV3-like [Papaver somniferum]|uniref:E3 ubiquitin-protein ligase WAV3-like n=1 Tax=Papaver somniferum TaxID=3469 RepID=UPI000E6FB149|nr:E3 ubiquitin-protein ligase WAV3-like [Papaver somniferum]
MGTGWRRAFCTSLPRDGEVIRREKLNKRSPSTSPSPRSSSRKIGGLFTSTSTTKTKIKSHSLPSTPRLQSQHPISVSPSLRCRITPPMPPQNENTPKLQCKTKSSKLFQTSFSAPSSPKSPLKFSIFKSGSRLSKNTCGICSQSMKSGQRTAIFTAECSHSFHFHCISSHVRNSPVSLVCPVCTTIWKEVPLMAQTLKRQIEQEIITKQSSSPKTTNSDQLEIRVYDDDEPLLLSPTAGAKFNSIPETDEEEIEEFQGFFVNNPVLLPVTPKSPEETIFNGGDSSRHVQVRLQPEVAVISVGQNYENYALTVKIKAPPVAQNSNHAPFSEHGRRAPIDLVTVLDLSGNMNGSKLQMLKRAMRLVISSLDSSDRLAIVGFSSTTKRLLPLRRMSPQGQRSARRIIDRLICGQGTIGVVNDGLRKAAKVLEDRRERNPVASVMLLSDGQDEGVSSNRSNQQRCLLSSSQTRFAHLEIPVHSSGFGDKIGFSHEPAEDAFARCVGSLLSVVTQDLRLQLGFAPGSDIADIAAIYSYSGRPALLSGNGSGLVRLGDLYAEEEKELLVELRVPTGLIEPHHLMSARFSYRDPVTQDVIYGDEQILQVPSAQTVRSSNPKIERLRNLFVTTRSIAESRRLVEYNDLSSAIHLLSSARLLLTQSSSISAEEYIHCLEIDLADLHRRKQYQQQILYQQQQQQIQRQKSREREMAFLDENGEPLTPTSAWRAAEKLAKVAIMKKSMNRVSDLHGFENARF